MTAMRFRSRLLAGAALWLAMGAGPASAQFGYMYPGGFGGWGGWGATTAQGDMARGMGMFAMGLGQYNVDTAAARSVNADTAMRMNEYIYEGQQVRNRRYYENLAAQRQRINESAETVFTRLRNEPEARDISRGDALNVALDELTSPRYMSESIREARAVVPSALIKQIPFNAASQAITVSMDQLLDKDNYPDLLTRNPAFEAERTRLRAAAVPLRNLEEGQELTDAQIKEAQDAIAAFRTKVEATYPRNSREWNQVRPYLKGLTALGRMLERPRLQELLAEVDKEATRPLSDLLGFMHNFNLRFGVARTPEQQAAYNTIWPLLDDLRDRVVREPQSPMAVAPAPGRHVKLQEFADKLPDEALAPHPIPPVPSTRPAPAPPAPQP
jgi:hypothetical protein